MNRLFHTPQMLQSIASFALLAASLYFASGFPSIIMPTRMEVILPFSALFTLSFWIIFASEQNPRFTSKKASLVLEIARLLSSAFFQATAIISLLSLLSVFPDKQSILINVFLGIACPLTGSISICLWTIASAGNAASYAASRRHAANRTKMIALSVCWTIALLLNYCHFCSNGLSGLISISGSAVACLTFAFLFCKLPLTSDRKRKDEANHGSGQTPSSSENIENVLQALAKRQLSDREVFALSHALAGETSARIASDLGISAASVSSYRTRGYEKLGVKSIKELERLLFDRNIESPSSTDAQQLPDHPTASGPIAIPAAMMVVLLFISICYGPLCAFAQLHSENLELSLYAFDFLNALALILVIISILLFSQTDQSAPHSGKGINTWSHLITYCLAPCSSAYFYAGLLNNEHSQGLFSLLGVIAILINLEILEEEDRASIRKCNIIRLLSRGFRRLMSRPWPLLFFSCTLFVNEDIINYALALHPDALVSLGLVLAVPILASIVIAVSGLLSITRGIELTMENRNRIECYLLGRGLSSTQTEIILLTLSGHTPSEICSKLFIAPGTVSSYRSRAYSALNVKGLKELKQLLQKETSIRW